MTASKDLRRPPGVIVEVAGRRLHMACGGRGPVTVLLEAGMGSTSSQWAWVQPEVATFARVCAYDRAGLGWSQPAPDERDALRVAADLEALLLAAHETPPYVLVGHSLGASFARVFAARNPASVVGLVLVDPTPLDLQIGWMGRLSASVMTESLPFLSRFGLQPLRAQMQPLSRDLPARAGKDLIDAYGSHNHLRAFRDEYRAMEKTNDEARRNLLPRDLAVTVLSAEHAMARGQDALIAAAQAEHARFAATFVGGRHRVVPGSNHLSLMTHPRHAHQVAEEVRLLVERARVSGR